MECVYSQKQTKWLTKHGSIAGYLRLRFSVLTLRDKRIFGQFVKKVSET